LAEVVSAFWSTRNLLVYLYSWLKLCWRHEYVVRTIGETRINTRVTANFRWSSVANAGMDDHIYLAQAGFGPTHIPSSSHRNPSVERCGYTSKAWWVRRVDSTMCLKWGGRSRSTAWETGAKRFTGRSTSRRKQFARPVQRAKDYAKANRAATAPRMNRAGWKYAYGGRTANRGAELERAIAYDLFVDIVRRPKKRARAGRFARDTGT